MRKLTKSIVFVAASAAVCAIFALCAAAHEIDTDVNGEPLGEGNARLSGSTTVVAFRSFINCITDGEAEIEWDDKTKTASADYLGITVSATLGEDYICANGRCLPCTAENSIESGRMYVAIRPLAAVFLAEVEWLSETKSVKVGRSRGIIEAGDDFYDADELYWLSRIISAEARGEPMQGKIAVGTVVYNRVSSDEYPDSVYEVIFDMKHGVQFTPAKTGSVYAEPTTESVKAAKLCMEGRRYRSDVLFFCTVAIKDTSWAGRNRPFIEAIGNHAFFA